MIKTHYKPHFPDHSAEKSWSLIDPRPIIKYVEQCDDYIVVWNGVIMTHRMALNLAMSTFGIWPTPEMKTSIISHYRQMYYAGAFGTRDWDNLIARTDFWKYITSVISDHVRTVCNQHTGPQVLSWFDYSRAR